eukprot:m.13526 g.13526  ORF g.13526 m.13526 type:complete len:664 (+) comp4874_c0_seq1:309-2300(+)
MFPRHWVLVRRTRPLVQHFRAGATDFHRFGGRSVLTGQQDQQLEDTLSGIKHHKKTDIPSFSQTWGAQNEFDPTARKDLVHSLFSFFPDTVFVKYVWKSASTREQILSIAAIGWVVYALSSVEAYIYLKGIHEISSFHTWLTVNFYSFGNLLPSTVWTEIPLGHITQCLYNFSALGYPCIPVDEAGHLQGGAPLSLADSMSLFYLATARHIVAGFGLMSQVLSFVNLSGRVRKEYQERLKNGIEPTAVRFGSQERVLRFCGRRSHVTTTSLTRYREHILPLCEESPWVLRAFQSLSMDITKQPLYVRILNYGSPLDFKNVVLTPDYLLRTSGLQPILCCEADTTMHADPLFLSKGAGDLTVEDATQGFQQIALREKELRHSGLVHNYRSRGKVKPNVSPRHLRVLLGDSTQNFTNGAGKEYTLRQRVKTRKEADVLIDAGACVREKIITWAKRKASGAIRKEQHSEHQEKGSQSEQHRGMEILRPDPRIVFVIETNCPSIYDELHRLICEHIPRAVCIDTVGEYEQILNERQDAEVHGEEFCIRKLPRIICHKRSEETVNATRALSTAAFVNMDDVCSVVQSERCAIEIESFVDSSIGDLEVKRKASGNKADDKRKDVLRGLYIICSARLHDDLFRIVRVWARLGYGNDQIQAALDNRYNMYY